MPIKLPPKRIAPHKKDHVPSDTRCDPVIDEEDDDDVDDYCSAFRPGHHETF